MLENVVLGIAQGISEWLPVSSEGILILLKTNLFHSKESISATIRLALFYHFGTFLSALIYFRRDVTQLIKALVRFRSSDQSTQKLFVFLLVSTVISGCIGIVLLFFLERAFNDFSRAQTMITLGIGILLLVTAFFEFKSKKDGYKSIHDLKITDSIILGIVQGCATLPGLSRSGLTVSTLLLRKFDKPYALQLSFLMSLPIVLLGNIVLNVKYLSWSWGSLTGLLCSFLGGLMTIHLLLKLAQKINFAYFVLLFGCLTILSTLL